LFFFYISTRGVVKSRYLVPVEILLFALEYTILRHLTFYTLYIYEDSRSMNSLSVVKIPRSSQDRRAGEEEEEEEEIDIYEDDDDSGDDDQEEDILRALETIRNENRNMVDDTFYVYCNNDASEKPLLHLATSPIGHRRLPAKDGFSKAVIVFDGCASGHVLDKSRIYALNVILSSIDDVIHAIVISIGWTHKTQRASKQSASSGETHQDVFTQEDTKIICIVRDVLKTALYNRSDVVVSLDFGLSRKISYCDVLGFYAHIISFSRDSVVDLKARSDLLTKNIDGKERKKINQLLKKSRQATIRELFKASSRNMSFTKEEIDMLELASCYSRETRTSK